MARLPPLPEDPLLAEVNSAAARLDLARRYRELDLRPAFPISEFRALGGAGLLGLRAPRALGGRELPLVRAATLLFHLGRSGGTTFAKLSLQPEFCSVLAERGDPALVDEWYRPLLRGQRLVGNQLTEPEAGSDAAALRATARRHGGEYVLDGTKSEVAFAEEAEAAIVYARVAGADPRQEITAFLVPQDLPGVSRSAGPPDLGERWMRRGVVQYSGVRVEARCRLGEEGRGFEYVRGELVRERLLLSAIYLGVARASWEETVEHVGARVAFGAPLSAQEGVSFPLVSDGAELDAAWMYVVHALERLERGEHVESESALGKWMATEVALRTLDHAVQFHGGRGYSGALPLEQRYRDVRSGRIAHGPSEVLLALAARRLWRTS
jgi:cyclohexanecarboxyl-CoA dehydrogenase